MREEYLITDIIKQSTDADDKKIILSWGSKNTTDTLYKYIHKKWIQWFNDCFELFTHRKVTENFGLFHENNAHKHVKNR